MTDSPLSNYTDPCLDHFKREDYPEMLKTWLRFLTFVEPHCLLHTSPYKRVTSLKVLTKTYYGEDSAIAKFDQRVNQNEFGRMEQLGTARFGLIAMSDWDRAQERFDRDMKELLAWAGIASQGLPVISYSRIS